jgi:UDP-N-acetylmuramoylalanine--D-glutamate ligase
MIPVPFLAGKLVAVMGLGKSGTATARALLASGATVWVWDDSAAARDGAVADGLTVVDLASADLTGLELPKIELIVWSPGIAHTFPQVHPVAARARAAGIAIVCDVDLLARARPRAKFLGITGTNGKSTTTTLLAHVLTAAGRKVAAGGNLGTAALAMDDLGDDGRYVLELSSYQLELVPSLRLDAGVLLNITPDHLGRHGGMAGYVAAKSILFDRIAESGTAIIGIDDPHCLGMAQDGRTQISAQCALAHGISAPEGVLLDDGTPVCDLTAIASLPGRHNWQNACAVYAMARADGIDAATIAAALATYPGLAHRQQLVAEINGVRYVNDSKATNADAAEKALVCYDRIYWIIGGQAKEGGIAPLAPHFPRIAHAFLIGEAANAFAATLDGHVTYTQCGTLDAAIAAAAAMAEPGTVVLLSPACASWDQFKSFEHRGDVFRDHVLSLKSGGTA